MKIAIFANLRVASTHACNFWVAAQEEVPGVRDYATSSEGRVDGT